MRDRRRLLAGVVAAALPAMLAGPARASEGAPSGPEPRVVDLELRSEVYENTRTVRVLLPPGYDDPKRSGERYPVFYFTDGRAAFDAWGVVETATDLWRRGEIPDYLFVAIDNGGSTAETTDPVRDRASEYLPYEDQTWTGPSAPEPRGAKFPAFLFGEVMPLVNSRFRTDTDPGRTGLAGDSYAGTAAIHTAIKYPGLLGRLLVESPSLHVGDHRLLEVASQAKRWPARVYLGVGTAEIEDEEWRVRIIDNVRALAAAIRERADGTAVHLEVQEGGVHWYTSWKSRLPVALRFLLSDTPRSEP